MPWAWAWVQHEYSYQFYNCIPPHIWYLVQLVVSTNVIQRILWGQLTPKSQYILDPSHGGVPVKIFTLFKLLRGV